MPRIGYQAGSDRSEWYTIERLLRKYASIYGIKIFVYVLSFICVWYLCGEKKLENISCNFCVQVLLPKAIVLRRSIQRFSQVATGIFLNYNKVYAV